MYCRCCGDIIFCRHDTECFGCDQEFCDPCTTDNSFQDMELVLPIVMDGVKGPICIDQRSRYEKYRERYIKSREKRNEYRRAYYHRKRKELKDGISTHQQLV